MVWAREQLERSGLEGDYAQLVEDLLDEYWTVSIGHNFSARDAQEILNAFTSLAQGHVLVPDEPEGVWVQAKPGNLVVRDTVRVRLDAYEGAAGLAHNGRVGVITAIRYGDVYVRYTDDKTEYRGLIHHSPHSLEKRVR